MLEMPVERTRLSSHRETVGPTDINTPASDVVWPVFHSDYPQLSAFPDDLDDDGPPPLVDAPVLLDDDDLPPLVPAPEADIAPAAPSQLFFMAPSDEPTGQAPESTLFPEVTDPPPNPKPSHHKKRPAEHIPRPPNAFILFRSSFIKAQHIPGSIEPNNNTLSRIIGMCWKSLPDEEREIWKGKARQAMEQHKRLYPSYRYNPRDQQNRTTSAGRAKRKVKEIPGPPPDPDRCQEIARLLVEGKKGDELANAVRQLDRDSSDLAGEATQPPQARFDAPMTERTFRRRSLSVPSSPLREDKSTNDSRSRETKPKSRKNSRKRSSSIGGGLLVKPIKAERPILPKQEDADSAMTPRSVPERHSPTRNQSYILRRQEHRARGRVNSISIPYHSPNTDTSFHFLPTGTTAFSTAAPIGDLYPLAAPEIAPRNYRPVATGIYRGGYAPSGVGQVNLHDGISVAQNPSALQSTYTSTFSSLEGWDGIAANMDEALLMTGSTTSETNSPLIAPAIQDQHFGVRRRQPSVVMSRPASFSWMHDIPAFDLAQYHDSSSHSPPSDGNSPAFGATSCSTPVSPTLVQPLNALDITAPTASSSSSQTGMDGPQLMAVRHKLSQEGHFSL